MSYSLPRPVYERLAETLKDRDAAESFASSIEEAVLALEREIQRETVEKMVLVKAEVKEDLSDILVTRDRFEERFDSADRIMDGRFQTMGNIMDERFHAVDERFQHMEMRMDERFKNADDKTEGRFEQLEQSMRAGFSILAQQILNLQERMDEKFNTVEERFKRTELWFKLFAGLVLFGLTLANPSFLGLMKSLFR